ncbi:transglutaminase-like cysteine peptidase [Ningiella sp. W23]|uniref:transglutaminase-like cysteine peptidase n=1 Tax=Ningiella sp. W23 TaxID=3023715 RepID=UPI00375808E1
MLRVVKIRCFILLSLIGWHGTALSDIEFNETLFERAQSRYGEEAKARVLEWKDIIEGYQRSGVSEKLEAVNQFFNQVRFVNDASLWQQADYWATPLEFLGRNAGDCEDFTIAKYFSLRKLGIPTQKLRLMYVTALEYDQAHMVLAYYETPTSIPLVLDNLETSILPASQRDDLRPVYSFNGDGLWLAKSQGRGRQMQNKNNHSLWAELNKRMQEGH